MEEERKSESPLSLMSSSPDDQNAGVNQVYQEVIQNRSLQNLAADENQYNDTSDQDDDACIPSDLISPSYFYSNDPNQEGLYDDQENPRGVGSHIRLISKMKSLESVEESNSQQSLKRKVDLIQVEDFALLKSELELDNLLVGAECSGQVSSRRHQFGTTQGIRPNLMIDQEKKYGSQ